LPLASLDGASTTTTGVAAYVVAGGEDASMLRVITDRQEDSYRLDLHGVLGGKWVPLLEQHWRSIMRALPSAKVTLVLSNVDFIDSVNGCSSAWPMTALSSSSGMHEPIRHRPLENGRTSGKRSTARVTPARLVP
jgi:hypothetical protein